MRPVWPGCRSPVSSCAGSSEPALRLVAERHATCFKRLTVYAIDVVATDNATNVATESMIISGVRTLKKH